MSKNRISVCFKVLPENVLLARHNLEEGGAAQKFVDSETLRYCDPYVPLKTGNLKNSGIRSTVIGSGMVRYETPYAKPQYYKNKGYGTEGTAKGGLRGRIWFERMKADHKKDILRGVKMLVKGKK